MALAIAPEVVAALDAGRPVVALESTLLAHGLPRGTTLAFARRLADSIRMEGAVQATIAVLDGTPTIGLSPGQLDRVCTEGDAMAKLSARDLGPAIARGHSGATTVAATSVLAQRAGITVFATGGLGGVHLPAPGDATTWDVSADLGVLASTPTLVVCSGVKSVLDVAATLEVLEARSVPVLGYRTDDFPAFYLRSSGHPVPWRVDDPGEAAAAVRGHREYSTSGVLLANPVPPEHEMDGALHDRLLAEGLDRVRTTGTSGSAITPVLLEHFHTASGGSSVTTNEALVLANATLAAQVAITLSA